jgi:hypothetical protein
MVFSWEGKTGTIADITRSEFEEYRHLCEQHNMQCAFDPFISGEYKGESKVESNFKDRAKEAARAGSNQKAVPNNSTNRFRRSE